jgi:hypothetical protein
MERRAHRRAVVLAHATILCDGITYGPFDVHNLSGGGALLSGPKGPKKGSMILLRIDLPRNEKLEVEGEVVREDNNEQGSFAVQFHAPR